MSELLIWALRRGRQQTLALVKDLREDQMCLQSVQGENHPAWILGHLLLGDIYLLYLLKTRELSQDFSGLLAKYGPGTTPVANAEHYDSKYNLVDRLTQTGSLRLDAIAGMKIDELARPMPDEMLAQAQPTIGHHLQALLFHEGQHCGQLTAWRKAQGLGAVRWTFAPKSLEV